MAMTAKSNDGWWKKVGEEQCKGRGESQAQQQLKAAMLAAHSDDWKARQARARARGSARQLDILYVVSATVMDGLWQRQRRNCQRREPDWRGGVSQL